MRERQVPQTSVHIQYITQTKELMKYENSSAIARIKLGNINKKAVEKMLKG